MRTALEYLLANSFSSPHPDNRSPCGSMFTNFDRTIAPSGPSEEVLKLIDYGSFAGVLCKQKKQPYFVRNRSVVLQRAVGIRPCRTLPLRVCVLILRTVLALPLQKACERPDSPLCNWLLCQVSSPRDPESTVQHSGTRPGTCFRFRSPRYVRN